MYGQLPRGYLFTRSARLREATLRNADSAPALSKIPVRQQSLFSFLSLFATFILSFPWIRPRPSSIKVADFSAQDLSSPSHKRAFFLEDRTFLEPFFALSSERFRLCTGGAGSGAQWPRPHPLMDEFFRSKMASLPQKFVFPRSFRTPGRGGQAVPFRFFPAD